MIKLQTKTCSSCKHIKPRSFFFKDKYNPDGLTYICKACFMERKSKSVKKRHTLLIEDLEGEEWRDVVGYQTLYQVSNLGRVKSVERFLINSKGQNVKRRGVLLSPVKNSNGYIEVIISKRAKSRLVKVHLLVWDAFGNEQRQGRKIVVDHMDNDKTNCKLSNLQLLTHRRNTVKDQSFTNLLGARKRGKRWFSQIKVDKEIRYLGTYDTELEAHEAYKAAELEIDH